ncbi:hypothetical protein AAH979_40310 [Plantactinospora sp. ZYX-F-223]|uniref:hypothetical protein n=1 Tax=Plantactinospora sp. ZYX-F-223 TaxID=3144103 RepID=UPI0031FBA723
MEYLRIQRPRHMQTAVLHYKRPEVGRSVALVGVSPVAEARYYEGLHRDIRQMQEGGSVVHFEVFSFRPDAARWDQAEADVLERLERTEILQMRRAAVLGWVHRREGLRPHDDWQIHEVRAVDVIRHDDIGAIRARADASCVWLDWPSGDPQGPVRYRLWMARRMRAAASGRTRPRRQAGTARTVLSYRIRPALQAVEQSAQDLVLVWDIETLPVLADTMAAHGFILERTNWHSAGELPSRLTALKDLLVGRLPERSRAGLR